MIARALAPRVVLVPGVLALLPEYAGIEDPVAELRAACLRAVAELGREVTVLASAQGARVAAYLLDATERTDAGPSYLVVGNGSARRGERAPGHLDPRAAGYDDLVLDWLRGRAPTPDLGLGDELLAALAGPVLAERRLGPWTEPVAIDYDDDPYGVRYWVLRWER